MMNNTNKFGSLLPFILSQFAGADGKDIKNGCLVVSTGNEPDATADDVDINELAQAALDEITHLRRESDKYKSACERHLGSRKRLESELASLKEDLQRERSNNNELSIVIEGARLAGNDHSIISEVLDSAPKELLVKHNLAQQDKGINACIDELNRCHGVAIDETADIDDANSIEVLIDCLQQLRSRELSPAQ